MSEIEKCEYCSRPISGEPVNKVLRGERHTFCSEFCFRLYFYDVPAISYDELQKMYSFYCVSVPVEDYHKILHELMVEED
jgi:hypothetical protein